MNKKILYGWLLIMVLAQLIGGYLAESTATQYALGMLSVAYVFLVTLASRWNFVLGFLMSMSYAIIALEANVLGDALYQFITVMINMVGILSYILLRKEFKSKMVVFKWKEWVGIIVGAIIAFVVLLEVLPLLNDPLPIRDALVFSVGLVATYSLVRGYKYNFALWIVSNSVQIVLWLGTASYSDHGASMAINYTVFLGNSIIGLVNWILLARKHN